MPSVRKLSRLLTALCLWAAASQAQSYPPPFPRVAAKKLLENDRVVVWDVTWPKGHPTALHQHRFDQLSVTLAGGTVKVTRLGQTAVVNKSELGSVTLTAKGTVHVEEGLSDVAQRKIMVELKPSASASVNAGAGVAGAFPREGAVKVMENDRAIVWDYTWKPGQPARRHAHYLDSVTVFLEGGTIRTAGDRGAAQDTVRSAGEAVYSSASADAHTEEALRGSPRAVIIEIK